MVGCPAIRIGNDTICATNKARLLGVLISTDLTFDHSMWRQSAASASTPLCSSVARHRIYYNTDPCLCLEPRGLLLQSAHRVTAFSHRQASARPQCSCPCHNQHQEVWKRVITDTASRPSLAGCYWTNSVPSGCNSLSVSARHGSSVPDWTVYACQCVSKSLMWRSSVRYNQQLGRTTLQTVNLRHPCVQCRRSSLLECLTGLFKVGRSFVRCF